MTKTDTAAPAAPTAHKGWHSRGYLPHCDYPRLFRVVTFRLIDAVPAHVLASWKEELGLVERVVRAPDNPPDPDREAREAELRERIARYEDAGHGACWLRDERIARVVENALLHFDGERYRLPAWCVMPNHVHALIEAFAGYPLGAVVHSWKSFAAKEANLIIGRRGGFWMPDYHDRYVRNEGHYAAALEYIEGNPMRAGLVVRAEEWRFSSAALRARGGV